MQERHPFDATRLSLDIMAVAEPRCTSAAVAYLTAGSSIHPLQLVDGFYRISINNQLGFIPCAACHPMMNVQPHRPVIRSFAQQRLLRSVPIVGSRNRSHVVQAGEPILVLGEHDDWLLVQSADGRLGFLAPDPVVFADAYGISQPIGCLHAAVWRAIGFGWSLANWLILLYPLQLWSLFSNQWELLLLVCIEAGVWRMMWRGPRVDPERIFLEGVLIHIIVSVFIVLISR